VQLSLPGVVALADGQLELDTLHRGTVAHLESHSTPECGRVHPSDCALCQFLSHQLQVRPHVRFIPIVREQRTPAATAWLRTVPASSIRLPDSRAPPFSSKPSSTT
jgi:hypothetical protein